MIAKRINENKITELADGLQALDESENGIILMNPKWMDFVFPSVLHLLQDRKTDVNTAWYLLEIVTR